MLRYYLHDGSSALRFQLSGELAGPEVAELEQCRRTAASALDGRDFLVDLGEITAVDDTGRALLDDWSRSGARFVVKSAGAHRRVESILGNDFPLMTMSRKDRRQSRLTLRFAALVASALLLLVAVRAGAEDAPSPGAVLARYSAALEQNSNHSEGETVVIDIDAFLPKLSKRGHLEAIRRLCPFGRPEYQFLRSEGDRTVRQQLIARYLSADAQAQSLPSSVAVSRENYKFRFLGAIGVASSPTYVFRITPKRKRVGLIQGELWIDTTTGVATHKAGFMVKRPSVFLRRVEMAQDTDLREGAPYLRITRLTIETRLAGRAEMTIKERAGGSADIGTGRDSVGPASE